MELEFLICQYLDGSLQGEAREDLETRLAMDANARELLAAQRQLDNLFSRQGPAHAVLAARLDHEIDWDAFAGRIGVAIAEAPVDSFAVASTIAVNDATPAPARWAIPRKLAMPALSYRGLSYRTLGSLAIAASLLIAMGTVARFYLGRGHQPTTISQRSESVAILSQVSGPQVESTPAEGVSEVSIGPGKSGAGNSLAIDESDDLVARPSRVVIASGINPDQDRSGLPY